MDKDHNSPYHIGIVYRDLTAKDPKFKVNQECPLCGSGSGPNKTPGLKLYKASNSFYCFACQSGGSSVHLISLLKNLSYKEALEYAQTNYPNSTSTQVNKLGSTTKVISEDMDQLKMLEVVKLKIRANSNQTAVQYLKDVRKIELKGNIKNQIYYDAYHQAVAFFDRNERLINLRGIETSMKKNLPGSILQDSVFDATFRSDQETIYLTEGVINALSFHSIHKSALALFSTSNHFSSANKLKNYLDEKHIILAFDPDPAGEQYTEYWLKLLQNSSLKYLSVSKLLLPERMDVNDLLVNGKLEAFIYNDHYYQLLLKEGQITHEDLYSVYYLGKDKNGVIKNVGINYLNMTRLFRKMGYLRYDIDLTSQIVKNENNIMSRVNSHRIQDEFFAHLDTLPDELEDGFTKDQLLEKFYRSPSQYFNETRYNLLNPLAEIKFVFDTRNVAYLYFQNEFVQISDQSIEFLPYREMQGKIWKRQVIPHSIYRKKNWEKEADFIKFLRNISYNEDRFQALRTVIGYLAHSFYESKLKAVILTDSRISEGFEGRSGKTLFAKALQYIKSYQEINGKDFDPNRVHKFQTLEVDTQVVHINDIKSSLLFDSLFNDVTEGISIERKNNQPFRVQSKVVVSTNRTLRLDGGSARDRAYEFELSDYYSEKFSPYDEFGKWFFSEWDMEEWQQFFHFYIDCIQFYLQNGLIAAEPINLHRRKLIESTNREFMSFMESVMNDKVIEVGKEYDKKVIHELFLTQYPEFREGHKLKNQRSFTAYLRLWAEYTPGISLDVKERSSGTNHYILFEPDHPTK